MHRIVFTGAQGTGKTTVLNHYKENGKNAITEVVRKLAKKGVKINADGDEKGQTKIFKEYKKLLSEITPDGYVSDRGLIDVVAYTIYLSKEGKVTKEFAEKQLKALLKFRQENPDVTYCYFPIEFDVVDDGVRSQDEQFRKDIDTLIKYLLDTCKVNYITIRGTVEERIAKVDRLYAWLNEGMSLFTEE